MIKIGVTGGIGSGKSTVCNLFKCLEIPVFNADEASRNLLSENNNLLEHVKNIFGDEVIIKGKPDRKKIAEIVFNNPEKLTQLNSIIHPVVRKKFNEWVTAQTSTYVIDEAAILFETGIYKQLDFTVLVMAPEPLRIKRVMQRDGLDEISVRNRMKNQWNDGEKKKLADFFIVNDDETPLLPKVVEIHNKILSKVK